MATQDRGEKSAGELRAIVSSGTPGTHFVELSGEIDVAVSDRLASVLVRAAGSTVVADISSVTFMDASDVSALIEAKQRIEEKGDDLIVRGARGMVRRLFEILDFERLLEQGSTEGSR